MRLRFLLVCGLLGVLLQVIEAQQPENKNWQYSLGGWRNFRSDWRTFTPNNSLLPNEKVLCLLVDRNGVVWAGTGKGIAEIRDSSWAYIPVPAGESGLHTVETLGLDNQNRLWFTGDNRMSILNGREIEQPDSIFATVSQCRGMYCAPDSNLWFFVANGALVQNDNTWCNYTSDNCAIPGRSITKVFTDSRKRWWIGTDEGNACYDGENVLKLPYPANRYGLMDIDEDRNGNCWLALYDKSKHKGCIAKFTKDNQWQFYDLSNSGLPANHLTHLVVDPKDNAIWIAMKNLGLARFDGADWLLITPQSSYLPTAAINDIVVDKRNNIWVATNYGLVRIHRY